MKYENQYSPFCDFVYYESSVTPGIQLAMRVLKPEKPSYIKVLAHGWHGTARPFIYLDEPFYGEMNMPYNEYAEHLVIEANMRGRWYSDGHPDCNGLELFDCIDAVSYAREHYADYLIDDKVVFLEGASGGGGNVYSLLGKFPDFFAAATAACGMSDYALWYEQDEEGIYRDEMDVWIGCAPWENSEAYKARGGLHLIENLQTPLFITHGEMDLSVTSEHARRYVERAATLGKDGLVNYFEVKGVGCGPVGGHWSDISDDDLYHIIDMSKQNMRRHTCEVELPRSGTLKVGGYVVTKHFSVMLDSMDKTAVLEYDLDQDRFHIDFEQPCRYEIKTY